MSLKIFLNNAPALYEKGYPIIPMAGKRPVIQGWQKYCTELPRKEVFEEWLNKYPNCNIGLCLGKASGLVGVDFDYEGDSAIEKLLIDLIPVSKLVKRGKKGWTAFYKYNEGIKSKSAKLSGTTVADFLSTGRCTVLPPSIHPDTKKPYEWIDYKGVFHA